MARARRRRLSTRRRARAGRWRRRQRLRRLGRVESGRGVAAATATLRGSMCSDGHPMPRASGQGAAAAGAPRRSCRSDRHRMPSARRSQSRGSGRGRGAYFLRVCGRGEEDAVSACSPASFLSLARIPCAARAHPAPITWQFRPLAVYWIEGRALKREGEREMWRFRERARPQESQACANAGGTLRQYRMNLDRYCFW